MRNTLPLLFAALLAAGSSSAQVSQAPPSDRWGYVPPGGIDLAAVLPPAPVKGDARYKADRAIFRATRKLAGTPRWGMATNDVVQTPPAMLANMSCAMGIVLSAEAAPRTTALIGRATTDTSRENNIVKRLYKRLRPYNYDKGPTCEPIREAGTSFDYPSGHTTWGWTWAQILAELAPDRATPILARGRAYGQSRVVCGVHNASAIDAAMEGSSATMTVIRQTPAYQADFAAAKAELARLRADPATPKPAGCAAQAALVAEKAY